MPFSSAVLIRRGGFPLGAGAGWRERASPAPPSHAPLRHGEGETTGTPAPILRRAWGAPEDGTPAGWRRRVATVLQVVSSVVTAGSIPRGPASRSQLCQFWSDCRPFNVSVPDLDVEVPAVQPL